MRAMLSVAMLAAVLAQQVEPKYLDYVKDAAAEVAEQAREEMRGIGSPDKTLLIIPLSGDQEQIVTNALSSSLIGAGKFKPFSKGTLDKILEWAGLKGKKDEVTDAAEAIKAGKGAGADFVLFGRTQIDPRGPTRGKAEVRLKFRILDCATSNGIFIGTFQVNTATGLFSATAWRVWVKDQSRVLRIIVWSIVMLVLPFLILMFKELAGGSKPLLPVLMIVVFTAIDIFFAYLLMGAEVSSVWDAGMFVLALAGSLFWNLFVTSKAAQLSKGA